MVRLGVFKVENGSVAADSVEAAIRNGYRSIDTAAIYKMKRVSAKASELRALPEKSCSSRQKCGMKIKDTKRHLTRLRKALSASVDYLDLYLIHW